MTWVLFLAQAFGLHLAVGLLFGLAFLVAGVERVDPAAKGASWRFRLLILPGVAALWPVMAVRWVRARGAGDAT